MEINAQEAVRFLDLLGGHQRNHHFQTFNDKKDANAATTEEGALDSLMIDKLTVANKHGGGIFVAVNTHQPKKRRLKKTTERINAIFADFDDAETAEKSMRQAIAALPATMVIESSPKKFHVYWVLATSGSIAVDDFYRWQKQLAKTYGSDPKVIDTSRVMRVPGFIHQKGEPFLTRIIDEFTTGSRYTLDELVSAFYGGRNNWLTSIAGSLRHDALPQAEILERLSTYNQSLKTPIDEEEIERIAGNMNSYLPDPKRVEEYNLQQIIATLNLDCGRGGDILPTGLNVNKVTEHEDVIQYNKLANIKEVKPPLKFERRAATSKWEDSDTSSFMKYINTKYQTTWPKHLVELGLDAMATTNTYDPLINYLTSVTWDGKPRVRQVFQDHLGVEDSEYARAVAVMLFVGAVKRAFEPGCQFPAMVVIVGEEGGGKSKFPSIIAKYREFYTDSIGDIRDVRNAAQQLQGNWFVEFPEMKALMGASNEHAKAFVSQECDKLRLPYDREVSIYPRRCVFTGSTNNNSFLTDDGANRRYYPIYSPFSEESGVVLNIAKLEKEVDQLWAEAVVMYKDGVSNQMPPELTATSREQRLQFVETGGYEDAIMAYMADDDGNRVNGEATPRTIFRPRDFFIHLGHTLKDWGTSGSAAQTRVTNAAKKVFSLPEFADFKYGKYETKGLQWRGWKKMSKEGE